MTYRLTFDSTYSGPKYKSYKGGDLILQVEKVGTWSIKNSIIQFNNTDQLIKPKLYSKGAADVVKRLNSGFEPHSFKERIIEYNPDELTLKPSDGNGIAISYTRL